MRNKLKELFKDKEENHAGSGFIHSPEIHIIDKKEEGGGDIVVQRITDYHIKGITLSNKPLLEIFYYIFAEFSFKKEILNAANKITGFQPVESKECYRHCECILFPSQEEDENWILLVETKYAKDLRAASKSKNNYPHNMIEQIISTSEYLRRHGVIPPDKKIDALVSFPNLIINNYQSTLFKGNIYRENENKIDIRKTSSNNSMSITQIVKKYKIRIKAQNQVAIKDCRKLVFNE